MQHHDGKRESSAISIAARVATLRTSPASVLAKRARALQDEGRDIILFSSGEVEFATPAHVVLAADTASRLTPVAYTNVDGDPAMIEAVQIKYKREAALSVDANRIIVSNGSKQVMFNALIATLEPGDEVIITAPYWSSYLDLVVIAGGVPVIVDANQEIDAKLSPAALERVLTSRTRWLILNNPTNPTGAVYSGGELRELAEVLDKYPFVLVMSDELYEHTVYDKLPFHTLSVASPQLGERSLTVSGVSKTYAMMGWRIGFGIAPPKLIGAMAKVQSQSTSSAGTVSQAAAVAALTGPQECVERSLIELGERRALTLDMVNEIPGLKARTPQSTFYAYIDCAGVLRSSAATARGITDDRHLARFLIDEASVVVLPGADCGSSSYIRINFACAQDRLEEGLSRVKNAIASLTS